MLLRLTRLDERRYETVITRSDMVTFLVKGVGHMSALPHDLAHFAVEQGLKIRGGFWGSVADGAVFGSLSHIAGRRKPKAAERSKQVLKENQGELTETEILVGLFNHAFEGGMDSDTAGLRDLLRRYAWTAPHRAPRRFTDAEILDACTRWRRLLNQWHELPVGHAMELVWPEAERARGRKRG